MNTCAKVTSAGTFEVMSGRRPHIRPQRIICSKFCRSWPPAFGSHSKNVRGRYFRAFVQAFHDRRPEARPVEEGDLASTCRASLRETHRARAGATGAPLSAFFGVGQYLGELVCWRGCAAKTDALGSLGHTFVGSCMQRWRPWGAHPRHTRAKLGQLFPCLSVHARVEARGCAALTPASRE